MVFSTTQTISSSFFSLQELQHGPSCRSTGVDSLLRLARGRKGQFGEAGMGREQCCQIIQPGPQA